MVWLLLLTLGGFATIVVVAWVLYEIWIQQRETHDAVREILVNMELIRKGERI